VFSKEVDDSFLKKVSFYLVHDFVYPKTLEEINADTGLEIETRDKKKSKCCFDGLFGMSKKIKLETEFTFEGEN